MVNAAFVVLASLAVLASAKAPVPRVDGCQVTGTNAKIFQGTSPCSAGVRPIPLRKGAAVTFPSGSTKYYGGGSTGKIVHCKQPSDRGTYVKMTSGKVTGWVRTDALPQKCGSRQVNKVADDTDLRPNNDSRDSEDGDGDEESDYYGSDEGDDSGEDGDGVVDGDGEDGGEEEDSSAYDEGDDSGDSYDTSADSSAYDGGDDSGDYYDTSAKDYSPQQYSGGDDSGDYYSSGGDADYSSGGGDADY